VNQFMGPPPAAVGRHATCGDTVRAMTEAGRSSAIVQNGDGRIAGIVTEQDVVRRIACRAMPDAPIAGIMTSPVRSIRDDDYLFRAIALMRRHRLRHMPVVDLAARPVGILDLHVAQAAAARQMMEQIDDLAGDDTIEGLVAVKSAQVEVARELVEDNVPATDIQQLLTHINRDIYRRVVQRALDEMMDEGWGEAPVRFSVIVMGSGGRGENYVYPDQDNGFILEDYPDDAHGRIDPWFIELANRMTVTLDRIGLPLCKGYVMATNPLWRKTERQWREQTLLWAKRRGTVALRLSDIFYDFVSVFGAHEFASDLRRHVLAMTKNSPIYLQQMYRDGEDHGVALGWFGRFITEKDVEEHKGEINLKHSGTLPLVEAVRLLTLKHGFEPTGTLDRLARLREVEYLSADEHDYLVGAFRHISRLLLRQQLRDFSGGDTVSNYVDPATLTKREKDMLTNSFKAIADLRDRIRNEFTGDVF